MRVLGIDPGSATMGWGMIEDNGDISPLYISHGAVLNKSGIPMEDKLLNVYTSLDAIIRRFKPDCCAIEELYIGRNLPSVVSVAQARGVAILCATHHGIPVYGYHPLVVKKTILGTGKADKGAMQRMMKLVLKLDTIPTPDDAADALGIAWCHVQSRRTK